MSGILPISQDNRARAQRCTELATSVVTMQSESLDMIPAQAPKDQRMKELLQRIASNAGMSGPEAFVQKMMDAMDAEDRADFESTYEEAKALGERVEIAYFAAGALFFVGDVFQLPFIVVKGYFAFKFVKAVWPMLAQATILGKSKEALKLLNMLGNITKFAKRAPPGFTPPNLPKNFFKFAKLFRIGAVLSVAGIGLFIGTLIAEKVRGDEIKKELQKTITDLSATRFVVKQMQMLLKRTENLIGEAEAYIILEDSLSNPNLDEAMQQLLKETIMKPAMESMMASYESDLNLVKDQDVMDALEELDDAIDPEWTEDDPDLQQILARIDELELDEGIDLDADPLDDPELLPPGQEVEVEVDEEDPASEKILTHGQGEKSERQGKKVVKKLVRDLTRRQKKKVAVLNMASRARSLILVVS